MKSYKLLIMIAASMMLMGSEGTFSCSPSNDDPPAPEPEETCSLGKANICVKDVEVCIQGLIDGYDKDCNLSALRRCEIDSGAGATGVQGRGQDKCGGCTTHDAYANWQRHYINSVRTACNQ